RVEGVGCAAQPRLRRLGGLAGDPTLEVRDVLAALNVDPDAPAWQRHQPDLVVRRATTMRSATAQPASSPRASSSEPLPLAPEPLATSITRAPSLARSPAIR